MPVCILCGAPNPEEKERRYFDFPNRRNYPEWHGRFMSELGIIGESDEQLKNMKICENHFNLEDMVEENETYRLKEYTLPINNLVDSFDHHYIKPELVYVDAEGHLDDKEGEIKKFTNLNPVVDYSYQNDGSDHEEDLDDCVGYIGENVETEIIEGEEEIVQNQQMNNLNDPTDGGENGQLVEPMMPFFLTDPAVLAILNENNEVGETIIVEFEKEGEVQVVQKQQNVAVNKARKSSMKNDEKSDITVLERTLCSSEDKDFSNTYVCDICDNSYGCLKCLKSHYESVHVTQLRIVQFKCDNSPNCPKGLYCPVCGMVFSCRTETLDHYVTHYVACEICCSAFDRPKYLTEHMKNEHHKMDQSFELECEICRNTYQYQSYLSKHYQIFHKMNLCVHCKIRFITVQELHEHEQMHVPKLNVLPYACSRCDQAFAKIPDITVHIRAMHKQTPKEELVQSLGKDRTIVQSKQRMLNIPKQTGNTEQKATKKVKLKK